jgi:hypothetical protein
MFSELARGRPSQPSGGASDDYGFFFQMTPQERLNHLSYFVGESG